MHRPTVCVYIKQNQPLFTGIYVVAISSVKAVRGERKKKE